MKQKKLCMTPELSVAATCVRIPVAVGHSESVYIEVEQEGVSAEDLKESFRGRTRSCSYKMIQIIKYIQCLQIVLEE